MIIKELFFYFIGYEVWWFEGVWKWVSGEGEGLLNIGLGIWFFVVIVCDWSF